MIDLDGLEEHLKEIIDDGRGDECYTRAKNVMLLVERLRQAEKDAARYQWLRCQHDKEDDTVSIFINDEQHGAGHLDAQIDEAMNGSNN